jgi:branched-chain amino acid transport system ATP-binding protein
MISASPLLEVRALNKRFGGVVAVKDVSFDVPAGEILGLIGPNGSGKSTGMTLVMGIERPDSGSVKLAGQELAGWPPHRIARAGVGLVFQHSRPLHRQTVLENIKLALLPDSLVRLIAPSGIEEAAREIASRTGLAEVLDKRPGALPFADLRKLELAKAIARDPRVVLVDEPFAGLTASETQQFANLIRGFREEGRAVLLVDHNVKGVAALVDRAIALYLGERIAEGTAEEVMRDDTVRRVYIGGSIETSARPESSFADKVAALQVESMNVLYGKAQALENVSIHVHEGEFVSVVGLNGAGKTSLFNAISGLVPYSGTIYWAGKPLKGKTAAAIARGGIVQCPETRELFVDLTVKENLELGGQHAATWERGERMEKLFELFPILKLRQQQNAGTLSGGEQQMLSIARALMTNPKLLILDEPTLGLAPVILQDLSRALDRLRQSSSISILLGEQNLTFALPHSDRVYVLEHAHIVWEGTPDRFATEAGTGYL